MRDVTGTLELSEPRQPIQSAQLLVNVYLNADQTSGEISTYLMLRTGGGGGHEIRPLFGVWPEPPTRAADGTVIVETPEP